MKKALVLTALLGVLGVSSSVFGATIFSDDFERGDLVGLEAITNNQPAIGTWTVTGGDTDYGFKGNWHPASNGIPDSYVFGGYKFGLTIRSELNVQAGQFTNLNATFASQSNASDTVRFEFDTWGQDGDCVLKLAMLSGATELNDISLFGGAAGGTISVGGVDTGLTYSVGSWHHLAMEYNPMASTFSLSIDGGTPVTGLAITPSAVDGLRFVQTSANYNRWSVFDNVLVTTVPEPTSMGLLFLGGLGALLRRKK